MPLFGHFYDSFKSIHKFFSSEKSIKIFSLNKKKFTK